MRVFVFVLAFSGCDEQRKALAVAPELPYCGGSFVRERGLQGAWALAVASPGVWSTGSIRA